LDSRRHKGKLPQSRFLEYLNEYGNQFDGFEVRLGANVRDVVERDGEVCGVTYESDGVTHEIHATLTVAADGRFSRLRKRMELEPINSSPPMDVLWLRLPRYESDGEDLTFRVGAGMFIVLLNRDDEWQIGYVALKGTFRDIKSAGLEAFRESLANRVPLLRDRVGLIEDWKQVTPLNVASNRLPKWYVPGLLFIGDAAHTMSPVGGVGINYAIQDAVAAVNLLGTALISGTVTEADLRRVQSRREFPTRVIQFVQAQLQQRIVKQALRTNQEFKVPWYLRLPFASYFAARLLGYGLRSEKIKNQKSIMQITDSENSHEHRLDRAGFPSIN
jgi:2-polyprenyl-6-methoxyphenol hydroxylase-like FAD-dependent oxidoreductase